MKRLSLFVSLLLIAVQAFAEPVQLNPPTQDKRVIIPLQGKWGPNVSAYNLGAGNYTTLKNLRYSDVGLETVDGYSKITTNALGVTPVSGFAYQHGGYMHTITKGNAGGGYYHLYRRTTQSVTTQDYVANQINTYDTLSDGPGFFSEGPNGVMLYGDDNGAWIYGAGDSSTYPGGGIDPQAVFVSTSSTLPIANCFDYTDKAKDTVNSFTLTSSDYLYIGTPWKLGHIYITVSSPNASASTMTLTTYTASFTGTTITDGTSSGGATLAQSGDVYISQLWAPIAANVNGVVLYWYRINISAGTANISNIKLGALFQDVNDFWNGSGRTCTGFHVKRNNEWEDYTHHVAIPSTADAPFAATVGDVDGSDEIYLVFDEPVMGFNVTMLGKLTNKISTEISNISFWDGDSYSNVGGLIDGTEKSSGDTTLSKSGTITWLPITTTNRPHRKELFGVSGYIYKVVLNGALTDSQKSITSTNISFTNATSTINLSSGSWPDFETGDEITISGSSSNNGVQTISQINGANIVVYGTLVDEAASASVTIKSYETVTHDGTSIDTIYGITAPIEMPAYNGIGFYGNRVMLIEKNRVDYSLPSYGWIFNGVNTSNRGAPNEAPLYFGDEKPITATRSLSNRYGSNIVQVWVVTKNSETYSLSGSQPYSDFSEPFVIRKMSSNIGCPAPMTISEVQVQLEDIQRNGLMWLDSTGPVIFDGAVVSTVSGIENYFDPSKSEYIKTSLIEKATAYYDSTHYEYNLLIPSGSAATANNVWLVYDLKEKKWFKKVPASYPVYTIPVEDTDGIKYSYGHLSSGHLMRLDNGATWDGSFIDQQITTGIFSPPVVDEIGFWSRSKIRGIKLLPGNDANDAVLLLHMNGTDASTTFTDDSKSSHTVTANSDSQLDTAAYKYGTASGLFDGTDDYISAADSADWDISTDWTIDAWVKHTDYTGNEAYVSQYEDASNSWVFYHNQSTYGLRFLVWSGGLAIVTVNQTGGSKITDSNWHHVAVVKVSNEYGLYLDGAQVGYVSDTDTDTFAGILTVGSKGSGDDFFDGHIDDIRINQKNIFNAKPNTGKTDTITVPDSGIYGYATISLYHDGSLSSQTQLVALDEDGVDVSDLYGGKNFAQQGNFFQVDISATTRYNKWNPLTWGYKAQFIRED